MGGSVCRRHAAGRSWARCQGMRIVFATSAALYLVAPAAGDDLKWRPPKIRDSASLPSPSSNAESLAERRETPAKSINVLRTSHQEKSLETPASRSSRVPAGPLVGATGREREPRKLKSVLVRRPSAVRPILEAQIAEPKHARQPIFPGAPPDDENGEDPNIRRTGGDESGGPAIWHQQEDPFETGPLSNAADSSSSTAAGRQPAGTRQSISEAGGPPSSDVPGRRPLRIAGREPSAGTRQSDSAGAELPMRSVLQSDPFERRPAPSGGAADVGEGTFVSQPGAAEPLEPAPTLQQDDPEAQFPNSSRLGGAQPGDVFLRNPSIEAERERAAEVCARALETIQTKRINTLDLGIHVEGTVGEDLPFECSLEAPEYQARDWQALTFMWKASALCHKPLYFEDVHLERYGHSWGWHVQPFASAAHFFTTIPILPYKMGLETPNECVYTLGYYRPGNCAPYLIEPLGTSPRAAVWEAGAVVGFSAIVP